VIVLDTNVISELAKPRADRAVVDWADAQPMDTLYATAITEAELLFGLTIMAAGIRRDTLRRAILATFGGLLIGRILPFDRAAAAEYAEWAAIRRRSGRPIAIPDLQIAAIARSRRAKAIATRNTADFTGCGIPVIDPWATP
jgi:predicted nucleic acid-binding protein